MGQLAAAIVILAGAIALGLGVRDRDSLTPSGLAGILLLLVGGVIYLIETGRAWRVPKR